MKTQVELLSRGGRTQEYLLLNGLSLVYKILFGNISLHLNSSDHASCQKLSRPIIKHVLILPVAVVVAVKTMHAVVALKYAA